MRRSESDPFIYGYEEFQVKTGLTPVVAVDKV